MFRENWRTIAFWRWLWRDHVPLSAKIAGSLALVVFLLVGGYFASGQLTGASAAGNTSNAYVLQTTVTKIVTVREHGRVVVRRVPVVIRRSIVHSSTAFATVVDTRVVTTPGGVHYVLRKVLHYVPVVKRRIVRVNGKTTTVTQTRLVPTVKTETLTNVVTNEQTVTNQSTVVVNHTSTNTVTQPVTTTTVETRTVTQPVTVTQTNTQTETQTVTSTQTETVTVTLPQDTTTVTVTSGP